MEFRDLGSCGEGACGTLGKSAHLTLRNASSPSSSLIRGCISSDTHKRFDGQQAETGTHALSFDANVTCIGSGFVDQEEECKDSEFLYDERKKALVIQ